MVFQAEASLRSRRYLGGGMRRREKESEEKWEGRERNSMRRREKESEEKWEGREFSSLSFSRLRIPPPK
jgi:hypothetical protein